MLLQYPPASWRPLGRQSEPVIGVPTVLIAHTMQGNLASSDALFRRDGYTGVEAHFGIGGPWDGHDLDGAVWQWQALDRQADAQMAGNAYATSVETSDGGDPDRPWSAAQLAALVDLGAWWCRQTGNPARIVSHPSEHGIGWHSQFAEWAGGHTCPNPTRIGQLKALVIPAVAAALHAGGVGAPTATPKPDVVTLGRVLRLTDPRMHGEDVRAVQARAGTGTDGVYGPLSESAVMRWQSRHGLDPDGVVGPATAASMGLRWTP